MFYIYFILVGIFGPPDTLYEGGYFKADMEFPTTYPFAPPKVYKNKIIREKKTLKRRLSRKQKSKSFARR